MKFLKENATLIIAFALPLVLIVGIYISTRLPDVFIETEYDFVYATCTDDRYYYNCNVFLNNLYEVQDGKLIEKEIPEDLDSDKDGIKDMDEKYDARIFLHDTQTNESREILLEEAFELSLDQRITSPDGVAVEGVYDRGADFFLIFDGGSSYGYYLTKGDAQSKLSLVGDRDGYYYRDNFRFLGWVEK